MFEQAVFKHWHVQTLAPIPILCRCLNLPKFVQFSAANLQTRVANKYVQFVLPVFKRFGQNGIKGGWLSSELTILKKKNSNSDNYTFLGFCFLRSSLEYFSATIIISDRHWQCLLSLVCLLLSF